MALRFCLRSGFAAALALSAPLPALAGGAETAHPLSITFKLAGQATDKSDNDIVGKLTVKSVDILEGCADIATPTKTQGLYLFIDCTDFSLNEIDAVDTATTPPTLLAHVASLEIGEPTVDTQKAGSVTAAIVPVTVHLSCNTGATTAELNGILNLKYSPLDVGGSCPLSGSLKVTGSGEDPNIPTPGHEFLVNDGSSITIGRRSPTINSLPEPP